MQEVTVFFTTLSFARNFWWPSGESNPAYQIESLTYFPIYERALLLLLHLTSSAFIANRTPPVGSRLMFYVRVSSIVFNLEEN